MSVKHRENQIGTDRVLAVLRQHVGIRLRRGFIRRLAHVDGGGLETALATLDSKYMISEDDDGVCYHGRWSRKTHNVEWQIRRYR